MRRRRTVAAGRFYSADPRELAETVDGLLAAASIGTGPAPVGIVVPHAGYQYSGAVAATAYARLASSLPVERVLVLGPAHFVPVAGCAVPAAAAFETPLGSVPVDAVCCERLAQFPGVVRDDAPHAPEHSVEVQLPFLQRLLPTDWELVPIVVGRAEAEVVVGVIDSAAGPDTAVVCSTDLSHYLDQEQAAARDRRTAEAIVGRRADEIGDRDACGAAALRGVLAWARRRDVSVELLDLRTSGDTSGDRSRVVGYGAFALVPEAITAGW